MIALIISFKRRVRKKELDQKHVRKVFPSGGEQKKIECPFFSIAFGLPFFAFCFHLFFFKLVIF